MQDHEREVATVAAQVKGFYERQQPFRVYHGSTNSTRPPQYRLNHMVDTSRLRRVLHIDTVQSTAIVEANVPMDQLVDATLKHNLIPLVVMEFPGITTGGGFSGTSGESSSFKYGFFEHTVNWIEVILASGEIVKASKSERVDLFEGAASSLGTLGVITSLELNLREAKPYVELNYLGVSNMSQAVETIREATADTTVDYVDGIMFGKNQGAICVGRLADTVKPGVRTQTFSRRADPWFYLHAESVTKRNTSVTEAVPLRDYLFRYDRGAFWMGKYGFDYFVMPFNKISRFILDKLMHTRTLYHALHKSKQHDRYIIQDTAVPYSAAEDYFNYLHRKFRYYPIWLCPLLQKKESLMSPGAISSSGGEGENDSRMVLNFGIWGPGPENLRDFIQANRDLEHEVRRLGGKKWLYAHTYYTESEFWEIYDRKEYNELRRKYNANHLHDVYEKVKVDLTAEHRREDDSWGAWIKDCFWSIWPLRALYAVAHTAIRKDYLIRRGEDQPPSTKEQ